MCSHSILLEINVILSTLKSQNISNTYFDVILRQKLKHVEDVIAQLGVAKSEINHRSICYATDDQLEQRFEVLIAIECTAAPVSGGNSGRH